MSVIAVSRGSLKAAIELSEGLRARIGSRVIEREDVLKAAERYSIGETGLETRHILAEHPPGFWETYAEARRHYLACFKAALLDFVLEGPVIYHGNLAHVLLRDVPFVLRVRINAPIEKRAESVMADRGVSREEAFRIIRAIDKQRQRWTQFLYDEDATAAVQLFDIVLNLDRITLQDSVEMVAAAVEKDAFRRTEESLGIVRDFHLAAVAQTLIMNNPETYALDLHIKADSSAGKVTVAGLVPAGNAKLIEDEIRSSLSGLKQVRDVVVDIKIG
ncbi:MAG: cytidylate kinase family protein [Acidobacteria bacterium]|nr:cytidylate kinase family protein [Acidobacteriota bacterium]